MRCFWVDHMFLMMAFCVLCTTGRRNLPITKEQQFSINHRVVFYATWLSVMSLDFVVVKHEKNGISNVVTRGTSHYEKFGSSLGGRSRRSRAVQIQRWSHRNALRLHLQTFHVIQSGVWPYEWVEVFLHNFQEWWLYRILTDLCMVVKYAVLN